MIKLNKSTLERLRVQRNKMYVNKIINTLPNKDNLFDIIYYNPNGNIEITNGVSAIQIRNIHSDTKADTVDGYPDLDKLMNTPLDAYTAIQVDTYRLELLVKDVSIREEKDILECLITDHTITMVPCNLGKTDCEDPLVFNIKNEIKDPIEILLRPRLLHDAMNFFRTLGVTEVTMYVKNGTEPVRFVHENVHYAIARLIRNQ